MSYKDKYLKYKSKYLELKNQVGGEYDKDPLNLDPLNLPDDSLHSFLKQMLLFLNFELKTQVKYFKLLSILGIDNTYIDTVNKTTRKVFNKKEIEELLNKYAQIIADKYNLIIYLPEYISTILGIKQSKNKWKKIEGKKIEGEIKQKDVVFLKDRKGKYNLVDDNLNKIEYEKGLIFQNNYKLHNKTVNSFFNAILLFLNNYFDYEITYKNILDMLSDNKLIDIEKTSQSWQIKYNIDDDEIANYAKIIADKYNLVIYLSFVENINGKIAYIKEDRIIEGKDYKFKIEISQEKSIIFQDTSYTTFNLVKIYNLVTTQIVFTTIIN